MIRRKLEIQIFILILPILLNSCNSKPRALLEEGIIPVMAEDSDWEAVRGVLSYTFEKAVRTPQIESTYTLYHVPDSSFGYYSRSRFLMLVSTLQSKGRMGELVEGLTSDPDIRKRIETGENFLFMKNSQWAKDQVIFILISKDSPGLRDKIESHSVMLFDLMQQEMKKYLRKNTLKNHINATLAEDLMQKYSWAISMERGYVLAGEFPIDHFLWMKRKDPDRWIFVRWIDGGDTTLLNPEWVVAERDRIGRTYYSNFIEQVDDHYLFSRKDRFLGRPALITTGLWERLDDTAGGPFKNYTFYDSDTERIYMIDIAVFAPGEAKVPFLRRMEIIAETFRTRFDPGSQDE